MRGLSPVALGWQQLQPLTPGVPQGGLASCGLWAAIALPEGLPHLL